MLPYVVTKTSCNSAAFLSAFEGSATVIHFIHSFIHSGGQSVCQSISQPASQPASQSVSHYKNETIVNRNKNGLKKSKLKKNNNDDDDDNNNSNIMIIITLLIIKTIKKTIQNYQKDTIKIMLQYLPTIAECTKKSDAPYIIMQNLLHGFQNVSEFSGALRNKGLTLKHENVLCWLDNENAYG